ncbi:MAG: YIP1 family protein, partial [Longimicrobiales bacterium]
AVSGIVGIFLWVFLLSSVITVFFSFFLGDEGKYKQYLAVVSHALIITAVGSILLLPLRIAQGDPTLTLNVGTFLPFLEEGYAFRVLKLLDLFGLWGYSVMAVGVTKINPRRGMGVALSFFLAFAVASALVFGIFGG